MSDSIYERNGVRFFDDDGKRLVIEIGGAAYSKLAKVAAIMNSVLPPCDDGMDTPLSVFREFGSYSLDLLIQDDDGCDTIEDSVLEGLDFEAAGGDEYRVKLETAFNAERNGR